MRNTISIHGPNGAMRMQLAVFGALLFLLKAGLAAADEYEIDIDATARSDGATTVVMHGLVPASMDRGEIAVATLEDGRATLRGSVEHIRNVALDLRRSDSSILNRAYFVLEPGITLVTFNEDAVVDVQGGRYTEIAYGSWQNDAEYQAANAVRQAEMAEVASMTEEQRAAWRKDAERRVEESPEEILKSVFTKSRILQEIVATHDDPVARYVALAANDAWYQEAQTNKTMGRAYTERIEQFEALARELPQNLGLAYELERIRDQHQRYVTSSAIAVGTIIRDFTAATLEGEPLHLRDVLAENDYVLVEFWASWCGPCRVEIPNMKAAYEAYSGKGFEIVSVSLDEETEDWQEASMEEELPWIDLGDQMAFDSEVANLYGVIGIPVNYLVDGDGRIVATHLYREKLDKKLAELFTGNP